MLAVIKTGGKQYKVEAGQKLKIEKIDALEGAKVIFDEVLFIGDNEGVTVGAPFIKGGTVECTVLSHGRHKKVWGIKHKAKKRYKLKFGHKQHFTEVEIAKIAA